MRELRRCLVQIGSVKLKRDVTRHEHVVRVPADCSAIGQAKHGWLHASVHEHDGLVATKVDASIVTNGPWDGFKPPKMFAAWIPAKPYVPLSLIVRVGTWYSNLLRSPCVLSVGTF